MKQIVIVLTLMIAPHSMASDHEQSTESSALSWGRFTLKGTGITRSQETKNNTHYTVFNVSWPETGRSATVTQALTDKETQYAGELFYTRVDKKTGEKSYLGDEIFDTDAKDLFEKCAMLHAQQTRTTTVPKQACKNNWCCVLQ